jgi:hypothetical protein
VIALRDSLPLLRQNENEHCAIRQDWLCYCLFRAAERAGYRRWWLAEHVAASVLCYLTKTYENNVVTSERLREIVQSALQAIGYAEVALRLEAICPPFELSLDDLAEEAGPGKNAFDLPCAIAFRLLKSTGCNRAYGICNQ